MKKGRPNRARRREAGIALLISIFILLLISVVAIALIVSSGTESALAGNYRSSTAVYNAALSGLEEARTRLLPRNPSSFNNTAPGFLPSPGVTMAIGSVSYVLNPSPDPSFGETQANLLTLYPDTEYDSEFGSGALATATGGGFVRNTLSVWNTNPLNAVNGTMAGPPYKWVRINPISESSLKQHVSPIFTGPRDAVTPIFYDGTLLNTSSFGHQVFEVTSLAVLPNGSQKLLQYLVTPIPVALPPFLAALTIAGSPGNGAAYSSPDTNNAFSVKGDDQDCSPTPVLTGSEFVAIGVFTNPDIAAVKTGGNGGNGIQPPSVRPNYSGLGGAPDVENIGGLFPANLQKPSQLDAIAQTVVQNADAVVPPGSNASRLTYMTNLLMSPSNILTVVANGDLDLSNWSHDGYGLLLVTGTFTYDPDTTWNGIILVIGQGKVRGSHMQFKQINGAVFVAQTRDSLGNLLPDPNLGGASVLFQDTMQGKGIRYSSCWINKSVPTAGFKILSFHEIAQ